MLWCLLLPRWNMRGDSGVGMHRRRPGVPRQGHNLFPEPLRLHHRRRLLWWQLEVYLLRDDIRPVRNVIGVFLGVFCHLLAVSLPVLL